MIIVLRIAILKEISKVYLSRQFRFFTFRIRDLEDFNVNFTARVAAGKEKNVIKNIIKRMIRINIKNRNSATSAA